jgi:hypothetical protein
MGISCTIAVDGLHFETRHMFDITPADPATIRAIAYHSQCLGRQVAIKLKQ